MASEQPPVGPECHCGQSPCARPEELDDDTARWEREMAEYEARSS